VAEVVRLWPSLSFCIPHARLVGLAGGDRAVNQVAGEAEVLPAAMEHLENSRRL
jgi:hypothetical protein